MYFPAKRMHRETGPMNARPKNSWRRMAVGLVTGFYVLTASSFSLGDAGHQHGVKERVQDMEKMIMQHKGHAHEHNFEVMERMSPEERSHMMNELVELGLALPPMNSATGRRLFIDKGCIVCHSVNGVGGKIGPTLNAADMPKPMNAFEFAARMWRGAAAMTQMQEAILGDLISLNGSDLANLIAFAHDEKEQKKVSVKDIPHRFRKIMNQ